MLWTLRICRTAWTRYGNCPGSPSPVFPLSDSGQRCRPASFFPFPARLRLPFLRLSKGRKPRLSLLRRDNSVQEPNAQPAPATGLFTGFGVRPQRAKMDFQRERWKSILSICGNKCTARQVAKNLYFAKHFREYQLGKHIIYLPCNLL